MQTLSSQRRREAFHINFWHREGGPRTNKELVDSQDDPSSYEARQPVLRVWPELQQQEIPKQLFQQQTPTAME